MTAPYAWVIDRDYTEGRWLEAGADGPGEQYGYVEVDIAGPRDADPDDLLGLQHGIGQPFQLWDDDGYLYYTGRWLDGDSNDFGNPLDDYGAPNAGCTSMTIGDEREAFIG